jgi:lipid-A-disaccharide synthase
MRVALVAGEASGDYLGAHVIRAIRRQWPTAEFEGIAGPRMLAEGARSLYPMEKLSVRGYTEVLAHLPELLSIRGALKRHFKSSRPDVFIGIDAPDFNLSLEASLKSSGIPTIQCVSPTVWAWRKNRIPKIRRATDHVLAIFPFEPRILRESGIASSFMGHPLAMELPQPPDREAVREALKLSGSGPIVALLPGSRISELTAHADLFVETALKFHQEFPGSRFLVPLITRETHELFSEALWRRDPERQLAVTLMHGHASQALTAADLALVASGTATLEAALCACPMVVTYRLSRLTAAWVRARQHLPYVSLPNILMNRFVVPELLQEDATPSHLLRALSSLWLNTSTRREIEQVFHRLHETLLADMDGAVIEAVKTVTGEKA